MTTWVILSLLFVKHFLAETTNNNIELGINLNFIPPKMKAIILQRLYNTYKSIIEKNMENMNKGNILSQRPLFVGTYDFMGVLDYLWTTFLPHKVLLLAQNSQGSLPILTGKEYTGELKIYLCQQQTCHTPLIDLESLKKNLA